MEYDFLKAFPKRMKCVGLHAMLQANSSQKSIWRQMGFEGLSEQMNMIFSVLLFIMEQSLKEEICTMDNIAAFIDSINGQYYKKSLGSDDCHELGDFIVNVVLSNEGKPMYFAAYNYEEQKQEDLHISYVNNEIVYDEQDMRRTSYFLTDDGYNLLLGTLEVENNLKLSVQEIIFSLHLQKQSYDRALDDVKNIFNLMRIQLQKIQGAMLRIRRNALEYSVAEYKQLLQENLDTIDKTKVKFVGYRKNVQQRVQELEEQNINIHALSEEDTAKLQNLREIDQYLGRAIDEYQRILNSHFDLKKVYEVELDKLTELALVQRFNLRTELYERILQQPECLEELAVFFSPLFNQNPDKAVNLNNFLEPQRVRALEDWDDEAIETYDAEEWEKEQRRIIAEKLARYEDSLTVIMNHVLEHRQLQLSALIGELDDDERAELVPTIGIFKEIMVELLKINTLDIASLRAERAEFIQEEANDFHLQGMLLEILDKHPRWQWLKKLQVQRLPEAKPILLRELDEQSGLLKNIRCSDVIFRASGE